MKLTTVTHVDTRHLNLKEVRNKARDRRRSAHVVRFAGVDSEAPGDEPDRIVLLRVGEKSFEYENAQWWEIFRDLYSCYQKNIAYAGFYLGYDFCQWLKSLPVDRAYMLFYPDGIKESSEDGRWMIRPEDMKTIPGEWVFPPRARTHSHGMHTPFPMQCRSPDDREWQFDMLGLKRLKLRPKFCQCKSSECIHQIGCPKANKERGKEACAAVHDDLDIVPCQYVTTRKDGTDHFTGIPFMYICDAGPFFQTSFLSAINPEKWPDDPILTTEEYATIKRGKEARNVATLDDTMREYNRLECIVFERLMVRLNEGLIKGARVRLRKDQWYGPGQAAQVWMGMQSELPARNDLEKLARDTPEFAAFVEKARLSYVAGLFEITAHGILPSTTWEFDIGSAYPFIMSRLPCLLHGTFKSGKGKPPYQLDPEGWNNQGPIRLVHAQVIGAKNRHIGPMPFRNFKGGISRPMKVSGWFWQHELDASIRAELTRYVTYDEWIEYTPCNCPPPLRAIEDLYYYRQQIGKDTAEGKAIKLVLNSPYGKIAQSIGDPRYGNPIYASLITAGCRTMILDAIATHPDGSAAVVMIATDGIYFRTSHPGLPISEKLGEWSKKEKKNLTLFKPGVYWDDETRRQIKAKERPSLKSRGINADDFIKIIAEADRQFQSWTPSKYHFPKIPLPVDFTMTTLQQALQGQYGSTWWKAGKISHEEIGYEDSNPHGKRNPELKYDRKYNMYRSDMLPSGIGLDLYESMPYEKMFGWEDDNYVRGVGPDGPTQLMVVKAFLGE